jgi:hypothetical protein
LQAEEEMACGRACSDLKFEARRSVRKSAARAAPGQWRQTPG